MSPTTTAEAERTRLLAEAEDKAEALFAAVTQRGLVAPGRWESQVSDAVRDLGAELFGTKRHWHKRVVRSGPTDRAGRWCHWILEVHLVNRERQIGGFFEQLLTIRRAEGRP